jgi:hypothetical protein
MIVNPAQYGKKLPDLETPGTAADLLKPKQLIDGDGSVVTGTIETKTASGVTASGATVTVPAGYYASKVSKSVTTATQATPGITVSSDGLITASATQSAGYVSAGTKSATKQLEIQAAQTITPGTEDQTIASGKYLTGAQTIQGDSNLAAENIKKGAAIFGVEGTYSGKQSAPRKDVNFIDYDGTVLYSYTVAEAAALTELPDLPTHDGLICQGWNWSLEDIQAMGRAVDVGAMYITDDGKTRLYIHIEDVVRSNVPLYIYQSVSNGVTIDWGDGSPTETLDGEGYVNTAHQYSAAGDYVITLDPADECNIRFGYIGEDSDTCLLGSAKNMLLSVLVGKNVTDTGSYAFEECFSLSSVTIPTSTTYISTKTFTGCCSLSSIVIPDEVSSIGQNAFYDCVGLRSVSLPKSVHDSGGIGAFYQCFSLSSIILSDNIIQFYESAFRLCYSLSSVVIPKEVSRIGGYAFASCYGMGAYHLKPTTPPTLSSKTVFNGIPSDCIIYVPKGCLEAYQTATNWSAYADYMKEED